MKTKSLVKMMTYKETTDYILKHNNKFQLPTAEQAEMIDDTEHPSFWTSETLGDRKTVYHKKSQCYVRQHPMMKHCVVLIREEDANKRYTREDQEGTVPTMCKFFRKVGMLLCKATYKLRGQVYLD